MYIRYTLRYLKKHLLFTLINIIGLGVGICICFLSLQYVLFEISYDQFNEKHDRIFRLVTDVRTPTGIKKESTCAPVGPLLKTEYPEIEQITRVFLDYMTVQNEDIAFSKENIAYADPSVFSVFTLPLVQGNPDVALKSPFQLVISESAAIKYFGTLDCIGETLTIDANTKTTVSAVMKDMPYNSHFRVDVFVSMATLLEEWNPGVATNWKRFGFYTYLLLKDGVDASAFADKVADFMNDRLAEEGDSDYKLKTEPLGDIYLYKDPRGSRYGSATSGDIMYIYIFTSISLIILFIAAFNFVNLTTAVSSLRMKEVGIRKTLGITRGKLFFLFLTESLVISFLAFILSALLYIWLVPVLNTVSGNVVINGYDNYPIYFLLMLALSFMVGLLSGIYPALILTKLQGQINLSQFINVHAKGTFLRKSLVTAQFAVSMILLIATLVVYQQLSNMLNTDLGFDKEHKIAVDFYFDDKVYSKWEVIKKELESIEGVLFATISSSLPGKSNHQLNSSIENYQGDMQEARYNTYFVDYDFFDHYDIKMIAGRKFSRSYNTDERQALIINRQMAEELGYATDVHQALGKDYKQGPHSGEIVGIVDDFHFQSLKTKVEPLVIRVKPDFWYSFVTLGIKGPQNVSTIEAVRAKWNEMVPHRFFSYFFVDENYKKQYIGDIRSGKLFLGFALIAIVLSFSGLFGLTTFSVSRRDKEISVRRVLGAGWFGILRLLTADFYIPLLVAFGIGSPLAWYGIDQWLQGFPFRIAIDLLVFVFSGAVILLMTILVIGYHVLRVFKNQPASKLRLE